MVPNVELPIDADPDTGRPVYEAAVRCSVKPRKFGLALSEDLLERLRRIIVHDNHDGDYPGREIMIQARIELGGSCHGPATVR